MMKSYFEKCIKCPKRYPACQDTCKYGQDEKASYEAEKNLVRQAKASGNLNREYVVERKWADKRWKK